ncbi:hypothetical protein [Lentisphaera araneosa]|uniref:hypothetical protein n=1 Tax=Lentisphaera araneosa TaxID=256847 RepID=UPI0012F70BAB|nr:hypothetical protein [Lentisphaera araneosa]
MNIRFLGKRWSEAPSVGIIKGASTLERGVGRRPMYKYLGWPRSPTKKCTRSPTGMVLRTRDVRCPSRVLPARYCRMG